MIGLPEVWGKLAFLFTFSAESRGDYPEMFVNFTLGTRFPLLFTSLT
jgi:hypothetical protein